MTVATYVPRLIVLKSTSSLTALMVTLVLVVTFSGAWVPPVLACNTCNFQLAWGSSGSGSGQFNSPSGVAVDSSGNVYVADSGNNRIEKFTSSGTYVTQFDSGYPSGVAVDSSGNVYVTDHDSGVEKFTSSGSHITGWTSTSSANGPLGPALGFEGVVQGVAVDSSGNVYVVDSGDNRVVKFSNTGTFVVAWGCTDADTEPCRDGSGSGQFNSPSGVAVDSSGNVYVVDTGNYRVEKFTGSGTYVTQFGSYGFGNGQFSGPSLFGPQGVAVDLSGNVYVTDWGNHRVEKFTSSGSYVSQWGSAGSGNGQFGGPLANDGPQGIAVDSSGNAYVTDRGDDRVERFGDLAAITSSTGPSLRVIRYAIDPSNPQAGQYFTVNVVVENTGGVGLQSPGMLVTSTDPSLDAVNQAPAIYCNLVASESPQSIPISAEVILSYSCLAGWNFAAPPTLLNTAANSYVALAQDALSDIIKKGGVKLYAQGKILDPAQLQAFDSGYDAAQNVIGGAQNTVEGLGGVVQLASNNQIVLGVNYVLALNSGNEMQGGPISIGVMAPTQKFVEAVQWIEAKVVAGAISLGLAAAATETVSGCLTLYGCIVPGALYAASALVGPVTDAWYHRELADPSQNFTQIVTIAPTPSIILSTMSNGTGGHALFHEYEYAAYVNASVESSARGYAASKANSTYWANLQYELAGKYASNASAYFTQMQSDLGQVVNQVESSLNQLSFDRGVQILREGTGAQNIVAIVGAVGVSDYVNLTSIQAMSYQSLNASDISSLPNIGQCLQQDSQLDLNYLQATVRGVSTSTLTGSKTALSSSSSEPTVSPASTPLMIYGAVGVIVIVALIAIIGAVRGRKRSARSAHVATVSSPRPVQRISPESAEKLQKLRRMLDLGLITEADYDEQRKRLSAS